MTTSISKPSSPAVEQAKRLSKAFDIFNRELFAGELPPVMLQVKNKPGSHGYFQPNKWKDAEGNLLDVISLDSKNAVDRPLVELLSTLVHEMCHQFVCRIENEGKASGGHGPEWRRKMIELGLPPIQVGATWRQATHSIAADGLYQETYARHSSELEELPWQECIGEANKGRGVDRVKFHCSRCGSNAWARPAALLLCGDCSSEHELVSMLPEFKAEGGGGKGSSNPATKTRNSYPEPSGIPGLPVWTDELGRELRTRTGLDHPPTHNLEALQVLIHGVEDRAPGLITVFMDSVDDDDRWCSALKKLYRHRASVLHPDVEGGSKVAFQALQAAYLMLKNHTQKAEDIKDAAAKAKEGD